MFAFKYQNNVMSRRYFRIDAKLRYRIEAYEPLQSYNIKYANEAVNALVNKYGHAFLSIANRSNVSYKITLQEIFEIFFYKVKAHYDLLVELERAGSPDNELIQRSQRTIDKHIDYFDHKLPKKLSSVLDKIDRLQQEISIAFINVRFGSDATSLGDFNELIIKWRSLINSIPNNSLAIAFKAIAYSFDSIFCSYSAYLNDVFNSTSWHLNKVNISASGLRLTSTTQYLFGAHLKIHFLLERLGNKEISIEAKVLSSKFLPSQNRYETTFDFFIPDSEAQFSLLQELQIIEASSAFTN